jgi:hypothetical protein
MLQKVQKKGLGFVHPAFTFLFFFLSSQARLSALRAGGTLPPGITYFPV